MKYGNDRKGLPLLILIVLLIFDEWTKSYSPWNPTPRWFDLAYAILFLLLFVYFLYDWVQMRRYYQKEEAQVPSKVRNRQLFWNAILFILCIFASILNFSQFLGSPLF